MFSMKYCVEPPLPKCGFALDHCIPLQSVLLRHLLLLQNNFQVYYRADATYTKLYLL